ncbi:MAG: hypothetical protein P8Y02_03655 [Deinococcales bacterium]
MTTLFPPPRWTLELARGADGAPAALEGRPLPATVPGCVHTDLLALDLIPDPLLGRHEDEVQWIGACDWRYRTRVKVPEAMLDEDRLDLHCEGLDTVATIEVNGRVVGRAENMHRPHRFPVKDALRPGDNELVVTFASALAYAEAQARRLGERPRAYPLPYNFVRKMACNFGWDWGPTLVTAGIWKPIRLDAWSGARRRPATAHHHGPPRATGGDARPGRRGPRPGRRRGGPSARRPCGTPLVAARLRRPAAVRPGRDPDRSRRSDPGPAPPPHRFP